jgi:ABC-type polysaccharide/polyol phosphate export permease
MNSLVGAIRDIYRFRGFIIGSVRRDFEQRYVNSLFGALWAIILPLSSILIYVIVFSKLMNARLPNTILQRLSLCGNDFLGLVCRINGQISGGVCGQW